MERARPVTVCATYTASPLWSYNQYVVKREEMEFFTSQTMQRDTVIQFSCKISNRFDLIKRLRSLCFSTSALKEDMREICSNVTQLNIIPAVLVSVSVRSGNLEYILCLSSLAEQYSVNQMHVCYVQC